MDGSWPKRNWSSWCPTRVAARANVKSILTANSTMKRKLNIKRWISSPSRVIRKNKRPKWKLTWRKTWPFRCWMNTLSFWSNIYRSWASTTLISFVHLKRTSNSHRSKLIQCFKLFISICRLSTHQSSSCAKGRRKTLKMKLKNWKSDRCLLMRRNWYCSSWRN